MISKSELTGLITFSENDGIVKMTIPSLKQIGIKEKNIKASNMQQDEACFEGWAVILRATGTKKVVLGVDNAIDYKRINIFKESVFKNPHYGRFLYRALRFSEQYRDWFELDETLNAAVQDFKYMLSKSKFTNNIPSRNCSENTENTHPEINTEKRFASDKKSELWGLAGLKSQGNIYRQLPVGLFQGTVARGNGIFSGGGSAIDLWTIDNDTFCVFELKAKNEMVGAITEVFFYSNLAYDIFIGSKDKSSPFKLNRNDENKKIFRGYDELLNKSKDLKYIQGFLLLDEGKGGSVHTLFKDKEFLKVLNDINKSDSRGGKIKYDMITYDYDKINK